jgi:NAD(P)-dependent dehydrogenase (short-subunit alcohol dehydrogenase family)
MIPAGDPLQAFRFAGEIAVVTGAGSGIGQGAALALAGVGAEVLCLDIRADAARQTADEILARGGQAQSAALDVVDEDGVEATFAAAAERGPLVALVNSAGISRRKPALELSRADWDAVQAVNVTGSFLCARAAARRMRKGGAVVNIASVLGFSGGIYPNVSYQASKGAVVNLTRALALEWAPLGLRVNAVAPGWIETPFLTNATSNPEARSAIEGATALGRLGRVEEVTSAILYLASAASSYVTGHTLVVDGGFLAR